MRRKAFTIVELLVVIGIITVLIALLLPVLSAARRRSEMTTCRSNLRQIGTFFQMYLNDSKDKLPWINTMPSVKPPPNSYPSIVELLKPYAKEHTGMYRCPADRITQAAQGAPPGYETYFEREGSSYQYAPLLVDFCAGMQIRDTRRLLPGWLQITPLMLEYEAFHGKPGQAMSMNYLYADGHVGDLIPG